MGGKGGGGVSGAQLASWTPPAGSTPVPVFEDIGESPDNNVSSIDSFNASMAKANADQAAYVASGYGATPAAAPAAAAAAAAPAMSTGDDIAAPAPAAGADQGASVTTPDAGNTLGAAVTQPDPFTYTPPGAAYKKPSATTTQT